MTTWDPVILRLPAIVVVVIIIVNWTFCRPPASARPSRLSDSQATLPASQTAGESLCSSQTCPSWLSCLAGLSDSSPFDSSSQASQPNPPSHFTHPILPPTGAYGQKRAKPKKRGHFVRPATVAECQCQGSVLCPCPCGCQCQSQSCTRLAVVRLLAFGNSTHLIEAITFNTVSTISDWPLSTQPPLFCNCRSVNREPTVTAYPSQPSISLAQRQSLRCHHRRRSRRRRLTPFIRQPIAGRKWRTTTRYYV